MPMSTDPSLAAPQELPLTDGDHVDVDEALLERLEAELTEVAEVLAALDRIPSATADGAHDTAAAVRDLMAGRFVEQPEPAPAPAADDGVAADAAEASDLVGDGPLGGLDEVEPVAEDPVVVATLDPSTADVGDAAPPVAEVALEVHDDAPVGDGHDLSAGTDLVDGVQGTEHPVQ